MPDFKKPEGGTVATLGLGGNLGNPVASMAQAIRSLDADAACGLVDVSQVYCTPPWGKTDQADFYNACVKVSTGLAPRDLLALCLDIERQMKRVRSERWGPRTIDIDILTYGDVVLDSEDLHLPHPRMTERAFVLMPLADVAPDMVVKGRTVAAWLSESDQSGIRVENANRAWWRG